jgi:hypothetical protein
VAKKTWKNTERFRTSVLGKCKAPSAARLPSSHSNCTCSYRASISSSKKQLQLKDYREDERCRHVVRQDGEPTRPKILEERWSQPSDISHRSFGVPVKASYCLLRYTEAVMLIVWKQMCWQHFASKRLFLLKISQHHYFQ